jgi:Xaa-Pro aminopeptidase
MANLKRIQKVQKLLVASDLDGIIVDCPLDIFYLTGLKLSLGRLVIDVKQAHLFVDGRYIEMCEKNAPCKAILTAGYGPKSTFEVWIKKKNLKSIAFDSSFTSYENYLGLKHLPLNPLPSPIKELRQIKEGDEIKALKKAAILGKKGCAFAQTLFKEGISEIEIAGEMEIFWKRNGAEGLSFEPIIAFGANSSQPHHRAGKTVLKTGDTVLVDSGVMLDGYASDLTRVFFFGKPHKEIKKIYDIVDRARSAAFNLCKPGTKIGDIDQAARDLITKEGYGERFNHGLGHGVGLEVHELPVVRSTAPYKDVVCVPGMVFTIEPGIYLPGLGGVRLEDNIVITKTGHEVL